MFNIHIVSISLQQCLHTSYTEFIGNKAAERFIQLNVSAIFV